MSALKYLPIEPQPKLPKLHLREFRPGQKAEREPAAIAGELRRHALNFAQPLDMALRQAEKPMARVFPDVISVRRVAAARSMSHVFMGAAAVTAVAFLLAKNQPRPDSPAKSSEAQLGENVQPHHTSRRA